MKPYTPKEWEKANLVTLKKITELAKATEDAVDAVDEALATLDDKIDEVISVSSAELHGEINLLTQSYTIEETAEEIREIVEANKNVKLVLTDTTEVSAEDNIKYYIPCTAQSYGENYVVVSANTVLVINTDDNNVVFVNFKVLVDANDEVIPDFDVIMYEPDELKEVYVVPVTLYPGNGGGSYNGHSGVLLNVPEEYTNQKITSLINAGKVVIARIRQYADHYLEGFIKISNDGDDSYPAVTIFDPEYAYDKGDTLIRCFKLMFKEITVSNTTYRGYFDLEEIPILPPIGYTVAEGSVLTVDSGVPAWILPSQP